MDNLMMPCDCVYKELNEYFSDIAFVFFASRLNTSRIVEPKHELTVTEIFR